jgi:pilus assembly protein CpaB
MTALTTIAARTSVPQGHVIAPLRLADTALATLLRPGDVVDVIAADAQAEQAGVVAAGARVVTIPERPDDRAGPAAEGALVLIDVDSQTASVLAHAAASATLSIIWR